MRRRRGWLRAIAIAAFAASFSLAGPGASALAAAPGRLTRQARDGKDDQPVVARPASDGARVALRPRGDARDGQGGRALAATLAARARDVAVVSERSLDGEAPRGRPRRLPDTDRSSRGPPRR